MKKGKKYIYIFITLIVALLAFLGLKFWLSKDYKQSKIEISCNSSKKLSAPSLIEIQKNSNDFIPIQSQLPTEGEGALNENIPNYISVRFQNEIYYLAVNATQNRQVDSLEDFFRAADYSFSFQNDDGSFKFVAPRNISKSPSEADLLSGSVFFLQSIGISLVLISQSDWFNSLDNNGYRDKIEFYKSKLFKSLDYILQKKQVLIDYDKNYSNRLFFDALAFIAGSKLVSENNYRYSEMGEEFLKLALDNQREAGYFSEKGGFDSSYQGVSLNLLYYIYSLRKSQSLGQRIQCGQAWLSTRIKSSGEVIDEGNSRVGGNANEEFLGQTKKIASKDVASSFYNYWFLSNDIDGKNIANKVKDFYK